MKFFTLVRTQHEHTVTWVAQDQRHTHYAVGGVGSHSAWLERHPGVADDRGLSHGTLLGVHLVATPSGNLEGIVGRWAVRITWKGDYWS